MKGLEGSTGYTIPIVLCGLLTWAKFLSATYPFPFPFTSFFGQTIPIQGCPFGHPAWDAGGQPASRVHAHRIPDAPLTVKDRKRSEHKGRGECFTGTADKPIKAQA